MTLLARSTNFSSRWEGWDWFGFASSLIGTFVGEALAGSVAVWVLRRQRRDRYEERIADAAQRAVEALVAYREVRTADIRSENDIELASRRSSAALLILMTIRDEDDRTVMRACRGLSAEIKKFPAAESATHPLTLLIGFVARMIARNQSVAEQLAAIDAERSHLKSAAPADVAG